MICDGNNNVSLMVGFLNISLVGLLMKGVNGDSVGEASSSDTVNHTPFNFTFSDNKVTAELVSDDVLINTFYLGAIEINLLEKDN
jgi:hypothetical protein